MKILIVLTSHSKLGKTDAKTGFWVEEFASPYYLFKEAGAEITIASPKGGQPPIDPTSELPENETKSTVRYKSDKNLLNQLADTKKLSEVVAADFDAVFYPGGHGLLWDLTTDKDSIKLIEDFWNSNKPIATVCHSPSVLLNAKDKEGNFIVKDKKITGFTNAEEAAVQLTDVVPFLLEDELKKKGAKYNSITNWKSFSITDGMLITGQNPQSSEAVAKQLLGILKP